MSVYEIDENVSWESSGSEKREGSGIKKKRKKGWETGKKDGKRQFALRAELP